MNHLELFSGTHSFGKVSSELGYNVVSLDRDLKAECPFKSGYVSETHIQEDIMTWDYKKDYNPGDFQLITASPVCMWWSALRRTWIGRKAKSIHPTDIITKEIIEGDIEKYGKPMVDKVREIINYFNPDYYIIENPQTGGMKNYITDLPFYDIDYCKYSDWGYKKKTRFWTNIEGFIPMICKNDCENMITVPTLEGDKHPKGTLIKGKERTLYNQPIGKQIKKNIQQMHSSQLGGNDWVKDNGKLINVRTKELRIKYKDWEKIKPTKHQAGFGAKGQKCIGGGSNRLERYRIPQKLIEELFLLTVY